MGEISDLRPPEPLSDSHETSPFSCGETALDDWLKRRARSNQASGATRTFVVCTSATVVAYYALASGAIAVEATPGRFRRKMPNPIPVVIPARLAVDKNWHGKGLGKALFRDAAMRVAHAADAIGIQGIVVPAISEQAKRFYLSLGFDPSPLEQMTLVVSLADLRAALAEEQI